MITDITKVGIGQEVKIIKGKKLSDQSLFPIDFEYSTVKISVIGVDHDEEVFNFLVNGVPYDELPCCDVTRSSIMSSFVSSNVAGYG